MRRSEHKRHVERFLKNTLGHFKKSLSYEVTCCAEEDDGTSYVVRISNAYNDNKYSIVLKSDGSDMHYEGGEDFHPVEEKTFFPVLFITEFVQRDQPEN